MPRDLTHVMLANDIRDRLPAEVRQSVDACETVFHMGAISHDSFLYGPESDLSTKMHGGYGDDTRGVVLEMLDDIRKEKPPAIVYIDDRAICFDGHPETLLAKIVNFTPWNK